MEYDLCRILPGTSLASLDETDIETLFDFVAYLGNRNKEKEETEKTVTINGKAYKLVDTFTERI